MESIIKSLDNKKSKTLLFYLIYIVLISTLLFIGLSGNIHADTTTANNQQQSTQQYQNQNKTNMIQKTDHNVNRNQNRNKNNWFRDGLSNRDYQARNWVSWHESRHNWKILSYGHRCIGYFQLDPNYLGRRHGHVNLNHKHQVKVADAYAKSRYGSWTKAKKFWQAHHWY